MTHSAIYTGTVFHRRRTARTHAFEYGLTMHYLDLDEAEGLVGRRFRRADYFGDPNVNLADAIRTHVWNEASIYLDGPVRLLTQLRSFGHSFNPVSLYYCFDRDEQLAAIVAEVTNTPWGERHAYVLTPNEAGEFAGSFAKQLHVSPFFGMNQAYDWWATTPLERLQVRFANIEEGERVFDASLVLMRRPFRARAGLGSTLRTLALIYGHAVALRVKGVRFVPHPGAKTREPTRTR